MMDGACTCGITITGVVEKRGYSSKSHAEEERKERFALKYATIYADLP